MKLKMKLMGLAAAVLVSLAGCGGGGSITVEDDGSAQVEVPFSLIAQGQTGLDKPQTFVIQDSPGWANFWDVHTRLMDPPPALPAVDFRSSMVIGVYLGVLGSPCEHLRIQSVIEINNRLVVSYELVSTSQVCTQIPVSQLQVIKLPKIDLPVDFVAL
jgi:predicted small lipoprotein YifL